MFLINFSHKSNEKKKYIYIYIYLFVIFLQIIKKFNQTLLTHAHNNVEIDDLRKEKSKYQWYKDLSMHIFVNGIVFAPCEVENI